jgi:hypothetical protein
LPATSIHQVCPPLLFPSALRNGAPQTLIKLFVFGSDLVTIYYLLTSILFEKIIGCTPMSYAGCLGPPLALCFRYLWQQGYSKPCLITQSFPCSSKCGLFLHCWEDHSLIDFELFFFLFSSLAITQTLCFQLLDKGELLSSQIELLTCTSSRWQG